MQHSRRSISRWKVLILSGVAAGLSWLHGITPVSAEPCAASTLGFVPDAGGLRCPGAPEIRSWPARGGLVIPRHARPSPRAIAEWRASGISDEIISANLVSLPDVLCVDNRVESPLRTLLGWGAAGPSSLQPPSCERQGWTYGGYDPLLRRETQWFEVKPLPPLRTIDGDAMKYEWTPNAGGAVYLDLPRSTAERILRQSLRGVPDEKALSALFWEQLFAAPIPVVLAEGAKKAASFLSMDVAAVGVLGVCRAVAWRDTPDGRREISLLPELSPLVKRRRPIFISFDRDPGEETQLIVNSMAFALATLLEQQGADVRILVLPGPEKGSDDFMVARGPTALRTLMVASPTFAEWRASHLEIEAPELLSRRRWWCPYPCDGRCTPLS